MPAVNPAAVDITDRLQYKPKAHWQQIHQSTGWIFLGGLDKTVPGAAFSPWWRSWCPGGCCLAECTVLAWSYSLQSRCKSRWRPADSTWLLKHGRKTQKTHFIWYISYSNIYHFIHTPVKIWSQMKWLGLATLGLKKSAKLLFHIVKENIAKICILVEYMFSL